MSTALKSAPPAPAPKEQKEFFHLPEFPAPGKSTILTVVAYNYLPEYVNPFDVPPKPAFEAVEFIFGAATDKGTGFVAALPMRYSLHEKASYPAFYEMVTGKTAKPGSKPDDIVGGGVTADVENVAKVAKKSGKAYTKSIVKNFSAVHPKLKGEITPLATLKPALDAILAKGKDGDNAPKGSDSDVPF
jgi:hypothetical protein